jgi:hypothetical protein
MKTEQLFYSFVEHAYELESLDNSLDTEREKCEYIRRMAQNSASLHTNLNHSLWIHLFMAQLILCQLSEKFSLLWPSVLEGLKEFCSEVEGNPVLRCFCLSKDNIDTFISSTVSFVGRAGKIIKDFFLRKGFWGMSLFFWINFKHVH